MQQGKVDTAVQSRGRRSRSALWVSRRAVWGTSTRFEHPISQRIKYMNWCPHETALIHRIWVGYISAWWLQHSTLAANHLLAQLCCIYPLYNLSLGTDSHMFEEITWLPRPIPLCEQSNKNRYLHSLFLYIVLSCHLSHATHTRCLQSYGYPNMRDCYSALGMLDKEASPIE